MTTYAITLVDNVPAITTPQNQVLLIDTGSPSSFSETGEIEISGQKYHVPTILHGKVTATYLKNAMHSNVICGLVGMDIISKGIYEFDYQNHVLKIFALEDNLFSLGGEQIDLSYVAGIPILPIYVGTTSVVQKFILDTGAKLSYAIPEICRDLQNVGVDLDFNPFMGENLQVNKHSDFVYKVGSKFIQHIIHENARVTSTVRQFASAGILGYHFMKNQKIVLNPISKQLIIF